MVLVHRYCVSYPRNLLNRRNQDPSGLRRNWRKGLRGHGMTITALLHAGLGFRILGQTGGPDSGDIIEVAGDETWSVKTSTFSFPTLCEAQAWQPCDRYVWWQDLGQAGVLCLGVATRSAFEERRTLLCYGEGIERGYTVKYRSGLYVADVSICQPISEVCYEIARRVGLRPVLQTSDPVGEWWREELCDTEEAAS